MLLDLFESATRFALALPARVAAAEAVGRATPFFAVVLTAFGAAAVLAAVGRLAARFAAALTSLSLAATLLVTVPLVAAFLAAGLALVRLTAGAAAAVGFEVAVGFEAAGAAALALAALLMVFFSKCNSFRVVWRATRAPAVRLAAETLVEAGWTLATEDILASWVSNAPRAS